MRRRLALLCLLPPLLAACTFFRVGGIRNTAPGGAPTKELLAEFWVEPDDLASRDLVFGPFGRENAPDPKARYRFVEKKVAGWSPGYTVRDGRGVEWSVKMGLEAQTEVVASRLVWALGYHQPPVYYLEEWHLEGGDRPGVQPRGRFRPELRGLRKTGDWSWYENPFVGTRPWRGLLVLMIMLNNSDLKPKQNAVYELDRPREGARRWFLVRDLGHTFGETGLRNADRNDPEQFEKEGFIKGIGPDGRVLFHWSGWYTDLVEALHPEDVQWTCGRLARLSPAQWRDAFRAGGYDPLIAERFVKRMQQKIAEGLALRPAA